MKKRRTVSPELETLDQLLGGAMALQVVRRLYPSDKAFAQGVHSALRNGDVRLFSDGIEVPRWRWRALFEAGEVKHELRQLVLELTDQGAQRVA